MKDIKNLGITTSEGFSVKNLKRFPSMEWGEEGGLQADLWYKGNEVMTVYNDGNGGPAICYYTDYGKKIMDVLKTNALSFLKRKDDNFNKYDWLRNKTAKDIDDDDFESVVNCIEERYYECKELKKSFKKGFKSVAILSNDYKKDFLQYRIDGVTYQQVKDYLVRNKLDKNYSKIDLWLASMDLSCY